ncbi:MAG: hypothetical protein WHT81_06195 [Rectinemataceae bacterium]
MLAALRVFIMGSAAVALGMSDFGGPSSALLRLLQLYVLIYAMCLAFLAHDRIRYVSFCMPLLIGALASCCFSALALVQVFRNVADLAPSDGIRALSALAVLVLCDLFVMGVLAGLQIRLRREQQAVPADGKTLPSDSTPDTRTIPPSDEVS